MDTRNRARAAAQSEALEPLGVSAKPRRFWSNMAVNAAQDAALASLPADRSNWRPLQDPVTGRKRFVPGISDPGGDDDL